MGDECDNLNHPDAGSKTHDLEAERDPLKTQVVKLAVDASADLALACAELEAARGEISRLRALPGKEAPPAPQLAADSEESFDQFKLEVDNRLKQVAQDIRRERPQTSLPVGIAYLDPSLVCR